MSQVFAFEIRVDGTDWTRTINERTAGRAKSEYLRDVRDSYPDLPFTALRVRKLGPADTSIDFERVAAYRGMPDLRCGQRVRVGESFGVVVGHNLSANFDVLFDDDAPKYAGQKLNVHPQSLEVISE